jgi:hypothetical protein
VLFVLVVYTNLSQGKLVYIFNHDYVLVSGMKTFGAAISVRPQAYSKISSTTFGAALLIEVSLMGVGLEMHTLPKLAGYICIL